MKADKFVKIASVSGTTEAEQMVNALKENGIIAFRQGSVMDVYTGSSVTGEDILVAEKDRAEAERLMKAFRPIGTGPNASEMPAYQRGMNRVLLGIMLAVLALCLVIAAL